MSEIKVQHDAVPEGAQSEVLTAESEAKSRSGFAGSENLVANSIGRGQQVDLAATSSPVKPNVADGAAARPRESVSQMGCDGIAVSVRPTDRRTLEGSTPGDSRAHGAPVVLPANPGPREGMTQSKVQSSKLMQPVD